MPSIEDGGVEKNLVNISNYLCQKLKHVILITAKKNSNYKFNNRIKIVSSEIDYNLSRRTKYFICFFLLIKELLKTNNKYIVLSFQANIYCIIISKLFGAKVITRSNASITGWSKNFKLFLYKFFYSFANDLIVNSNALKKEFKKILKLKSKLIYNPLDRKRILNLYKKKINNNFFNKKTLNLINIGRLVDQKDQLTILKSINLLKKDIDIRLMIIGNGYKLNILKKFVSRNKLNKNVKFIKFTRNPFPYFKKTDIFILSSIFEGLPNVLMESMLLKRFIISSDCPTGPREILKNGNLGQLFKMKDYKNLAKLIKYYSANNYNKKNKIKKAYNSLDRFDYNKNLSLYLKIIIKNFNEYKI